MAEISYRKMRRTTTRFAVRTQLFSRCRSIECFLRENSTRGGFSGGVMRSALPNADIIVARAKRMLRTATVSMPPPERSVRRTSGNRLDAAAYGRVAAIIRICKLCSSPASGTRGVPARQVSNFAWPRAERRLVPAAMDPAIYLFEI